MNSDISTQYSELTADNAPYAHDQPTRSGVLLVNLGTPDAPEASAVRRYLAEFLSDPRVVDAPRWLWRIILHGVILRVRPGPVARKYATIWHPEGSPLLVYSRRLTQGVAQRLSPLDQDQVVVDLAMTYGKPSIPDALRAMKEQGVRRLLILPLFPQYSSTTTAAAYDAVARALAKERWLPEVRWINTYHDNPGYIRALADTVRRHQEQHGVPDRLVMSFHGIPQRYFLTGDPYHCMCLATGRLLAEALKLKDDAWEVAFQSRFGRETWLQPYLDQRLGEISSEGVKHVQVICPGFAADCLETLEEIAEENRELFLESGGETFSYIPALNDQPRHADLLAALARDHVNGWPGWQPVEPALEQRAERARRLGAGG
ncbi:MAG: ferrochelatase [Pseudomonadota bacterium]